jgi:hypothetical protein
LNALLPAHVGLGALLLSTQTVISLSLNFVRFFVFVACE